MSNNERISTRVCEIIECDNLIMYKAHCSCSSDDHTHTLELEYSEDLEMVCLNIYHMSRTNYWTKSVWHRFKVACRVLFSGYIEYSSEFLFDNEKQIDAYINALQQGRERLKKS